MHCPLVMPSLPHPSPNALSCNTGGSSKQCLCLHPAPLRTHRGERGCQTGVNLFPSSLSPLFPLCSYPYVHCFHFIRLSSVNLHNPESYFKKKKKTKQTILGTSSPPPPPTQLPSTPHHSPLMKKKHTPVLCVNVFINQERADSHTHTPSNPFQQNDDEGCGCDAPGCVGGGAGEGKDPLLR